MLVQAQVVPWWGSGRPAEQSQWNQPVTGIAHRQEDRRVRLQNRVVSTTARRAIHALSRNENFLFFLFVGIYLCFGGLSLVFVRVNHSTASPTPKVNPLFSANASLSVW